MIESGKNLTGFILILAICLSASLTPSSERHEEEQALVEYYLQVARENYQLLDLSRSARPFELLLVTRRITLDADADTVQLDTAIIKATYRRSGIHRASADSLLPDTVEILQSSFLEEKPVLPALFLSPPWQGIFIYGLYPNDPGSGDIALWYRTDLSQAPETAAARDGLFLIDRSTGRMTYSLDYYVGEDGASRSVEYVFMEIDGALIPQKVVEHLSRSASSGSGYYIFETYLLQANLK